MIGPAFIAAIGDMPNVNAVEQPGLRGLYDIALPLTGPDGKPDDDAPKVRFNANLIAAEDDFFQPGTNIDADDFRGAELLLSIDAALGIPLREFGGGVSTRTAAIAIQIVGDNTIREKIDRMAEAVVDWIETAEIVSPNFLMELERGGKVAQLLSFTVIDATPDADENYERTVIQAEAVTVPT